MERDGLVNDESMSGLARERMEASAALKRSLDQGHYDTITRIAEAIIHCYNDNGKVLIFGNGGSAADAQHIAAELVSKFYMERRGLAAIALNTNTSVITAVGNDYGYKRTFARQVEALVSKGDVVIGISTSGNSPNVLEALELAGKAGALTVGLAGKEGGLIDRAAELVLNVPSTDTPRIQEVHITAGHIICELVERELFGTGGEGS